MTDYTKTVDFAAKDALLTGNPAKLVKGTEIDTEYNNIATAIATKIETNGALGTPISGVLTNCTGTASGLTAGGNALLAGSGTQTFSAAHGSSANHVVTLDQISLMPTVASATTPDIFGAAGATINYTGTTTATGLVACTAGQVGSKKTIIPASNVSFTASASMTVDGSTSGTFLMPANATVEVLATSTTTFAIRTVYASIGFTPAYELSTPGTSSFGTYSVQSGSAIKIGRKVTAHVYITSGTFSLGTGSGDLRVINLPFACNSSISGSGIVNFSNSFVTVAPVQVRMGAATSYVIFSNTSGATVSGITSVNCASSLRTEFVVEYYV